MTVARKIQRAVEGASLIRKVADEVIRMRQDGKGDVLDLSLGNPILEPPAAFREALVDFLKTSPDGHHRYMPNNGYKETRSAIADYLKGEFNMPFNAEHISMSVGAAGGINTVLKVLLDPGEEVIFPTPYFVEYGFYIDNHGGSSVIVPSLPDFQLDIDAIESALCERTRVILLNSPNNPTGVLYSAETLKKLSILLQKHNETHERPVYILHDTPYRRLLFDVEHAPDPIEYYDHCFMVTSFSKDLALPGERIGYVAISPNCKGGAECFEAMAFASRALGFVNAPALMQRLVPQLLNESVDINWYKSRRDRLYNALVSYGYEVIKPDGAFYLFPSAPGGDDVAFFERLKESRLLIVPGSGFGSPGHFRIAYCVDEKVIEQALPIFEQAIKDFS